MIRARKKQSGRSREEKKMKRKEKKKSNAIKTEKKEKKWGRKKTKVIEAYPLSRLLTLSTPESTRAFPVAPKPLTTATRSGEKPI